MKIVDKSNSGEVTAYHLGDVIADDDNFYLVIKDQDSEEFCLLNLTTNTALRWYDDLNILFRENHEPGEQLINACVVVNSRE